MSQNSFLEEDTDFLLWVRDKTKELLKYFNVSTCHISKLQANHSTSFSEAEAKNMKLQLLPIKALVPSMNEGTPSLHKKLIGSTKSGCNDLVRVFATVRKDHSSLPLRLTTYRKWRSHKAKSMNGRTRIHVAIFSRGTR